MIFLRFLKRVLVVIPILVILFLFILLWFSGPSFFESACNSLWVTCELLGEWAEE